MHLLQHFHVLCLCIIITSHYKEEVPEAPETPTYAAAGTLCCLIPRDGKKSAVYLECEL